MFSYMIPRWNALNPERAPNNLASDVAAQVGSALEANPALNLGFVPRRPPRRPADTHLRGAEGRPCRRQLVGGVVRRASPRRPGRSGWDGPQAIGRLSAFRASRRDGAGPGQRRAARHGRVAVKPPPGRRRPRRRPAAVAAGHAAPDCGDVPGGAVHLRAGAAAAAGARSRRPIGWAPAISSPRTRRGRRRDRARRPARSTAWPRELAARNEALQPVRSRCGGRCSPTSRTSCKTPLTAMRGYLDTLRMPDGRSTRDTRALLRHDRARDAASRAHRRRICSIWRATRTASARSTCACSPSSGCSSTSSARTSATPRAAACRCPSRRRRRPPIRSSPIRDRIEQVIDNLVANALRHTPTGGIVDLDASADDQGVCAVGGRFRRRHRAGAPAARVRSLLQGRLRRAAAARAAAASGCRSSRPSSSVTAVR